MAVPVGYLPLFPVSMSHRSFEFDTTFSMQIPLYTAQTALLTLHPFHLHIVARMGSLHQLPHLSGRGVFPDSAKQH